LNHFWAWIDGILRALFGDRGASFLADIFAFDKSEPLNFITLYFWGFFAFVLVVYSLIYRNRVARNVFLFFVSIFFYYKSSGVFFLILVFSTIFDYAMGFLIDGASTTFKRKLFAAFSISVNLGILVYFKYSYFFTQSFNELFGMQVVYYNHFNAAMNAAFDTALDVDRLILPVGVSFFTFQTISYAVDVYRRKVKPVNSILDFGFFVTFFPQLVAGPIVRAADFIPQIYKPYRLSRLNFGVAIFWMLKGLVKKVVLADYIGANFVDRIFDNPELYTGFESLMALYGYSLQVYGDFSGYTDIAIGVALLLGFRLPQNFNSPYKARNVAEFWKRWHLSLSTWLRDYLYIPLGGNKGSSVLTWVFYAILPVMAVGYFGLNRLPWILFVYVLLVVGFMYLDYRYPKTRLDLATNANLMLTMLLGGFWHGANWNFVIWGGLNGLALVVFRYWRKVSPWEGRNGIFWVFFTTFLTFSFISFTRIWFRASDLDTVALILGRIRGHFGWEHIWAVTQNYWAVFLTIILGMVLHWLPSKWKDTILEEFVRAHVVVKAVAVCWMIFLVYQAMSSGLQPFIYFQF
jgi:alginate O-acetyltransferase complex protein AlgI